VRECIPADGDITEDLDDREKMETFLENLSDLGVTEFLVEFFTPVCRRTEQGKT